jgi:hypothetical protein
LSALSTLVATLEQDQALLEPQRLRERAEAMDRLETLLLDEPIGDPGRLGARASAIRARLESADSDLFQFMRSEIRRGAGKDCLLQWWAARDVGRIRGDGYDDLDDLVAGILQFDQPMQESVERTAEMVAYQPTPARHIFDLIGRAALDENDVLVDVGAGLGHVAMLAAICSAARTIGIEMEGAHVDCARRSAQSLQLPRVTFIRQDARVADYSSGTLFYLYTPFTGTVLRAVLDQLREQASGRQIRVCTYGPCTQWVAHEPWLEACDPLHADRVVILRSRR